MPRRETPQALCLAIGKRVKAFRLAAGLTQDEVADIDGASEALAGKKGHISSVEHGLGNPTVQTLERIAEALDEPLGGVEIVDLLVSPESSLRHAVIELTRTLSEEALSEILSRYGPAPELVPQKRKRVRHRASGARPKAR